MYNVVVVTGEDGAPGFREFDIKSLAMDLFEHYVSLEILLYL